MLGRELHVLAARPELFLAHCHNTLRLEGWDDAIAGPFIEDIRAQLAGRRWLRFSNDSRVERRALVGVVPLGAQINGLDWSPDSRLIAAALIDGSARVVDCDSQRSVGKLLRHTGACTSVAWSPDGEVIASSGADGTIVIWDADTSAVRQVVEPGCGEVYRIVWSADGRSLASAAADGSIHVWDAGDEFADHPVGHHDGRALTVAWHPADAVLVSGGDDGHVLVWDARSGEQICNLAGHEGWVQAVAFSPDGRLILSAGRDHAICAWTCEAGLIERMPGSFQNIMALAWSASGTGFAAASWDHTVRLWDAGTLRETAALVGETAWVLALAWHSDGLLASGGAEGSVHLWDPDEALKERVPFKDAGGHTDDVWALAWSPNAGTLASGSGDGTSTPGRGDNSVRLWRPRDSSQRRVLEGHTNDVCAIAWAPRGEVLASGSFDQTVRLWEAESGTCIATLPDTAGIVMAFSPVGAAVATTTGGKRILLKDGRWSTIAVLEGHTGRVNALVWSPDGRFLASASDDRTVHIWSPPEQSPKAVLQDHEDIVLTLAWSPDGETLASGGGTTTAVGVASLDADCAIRLWAMPHAEPRRLAVHDGSVRSLAWSPDGCLLASGATDQTVRVWSVDNEREPLFARCLSWVAALQFSADGRILHAADDGAASGNRPICYSYAIERGLD